MKKWTSFFAPLPSQNWMHACLTFSLFSFFSILFSSSTSSHLASTLLYSYHTAKQRTINTRKRNDTTTTALLVWNPKTFFSLVLLAFPSISFHFSWVSFLTEKREEDICYKYTLFPSKKYLGRKKAASQLTLHNNNDSGNGRSLKIRKSFFTSCVCIT